jgi:hypothetical protein
MNVMAGLVPAVPILWHNVANLSGTTGPRRGAYHRAALCADPLAAAR